MYATRIFRSDADTNEAMARVYAQLFWALITSTVIAVVVAGNLAVQEFFFTGALRWVTVLAPLVSVVAIGMVWQRYTRSQLQIMLHGFAGIMALSLSGIFTVFTLGSTVSAFVAAATLFAVMSMYGLMTKRSLTSWQSFLFVGVIAVILTSVVNSVTAAAWPGVFDNSLISNVVSAVAILVFLGLTAHDTQAIRDSVSVANDGRIEVMSALTLYLNLVNIFVSLLQLFGHRE